MKKTLLTGLAAIAAMGLSCAKDMSVYNPQPEVIGQSETETIYKQVSWDREHIELSVLTTENGIITSGTVWTRYEPADSKECAKIEFYDVRPVEWEMSETETIQGIWTQYFSDESCDRTFENGPDVYVFSHDPAVIEAETQEFRNDEFDAYMQTITSNFNIEQMVEDWHRAKGL